MSYCDGCATADAENRTLRSHLETARKALEAVRVRVKDLDAEFPKDSDDVFEAIEDIRGIALRALDTPAATPGKGACAGWCGTEDSDATCTWHKAGDRNDYCSKACADAGAPRSPSRSSK